MLTVTAWSSRKMLFSPAKLFVFCASRSIWKSFSMSATHTNRSKKPVPCGWTSVAPDAHWPLGRSPLGPNSGDRVFDEIASVWVSSIGTQARNLSSSPSTPGGVIA